MGRYSLHAADQVVIAGYFLLLAAVGFYFWRRMRHVRDLFTGGNNIPWWLAGVSFYLTAFSAFAFVAYSAIVVTDYVQFVILTIGVAVLFPLVFSHMGGIGAGLKTVWRDHPAGFLSPFAHPYSILYIVAFYLLVILSYNGNWAFAQKFYSVRNEREARKAGILDTVLKILGPPPFVLLAMAAHYLMPELAQPPNSPHLLPAGSGRTIDVAVGLFLCISGSGFYVLGRGRG